MNGLWQIIAMVVFSLLVVAFYVLILPFLGSGVVVNTVVTVFSFTVSDEVKNHSLFLSIYSFSLFSETIFR